jgi:hypothetical protein
LKRVLVRGGPVGPEIAIREANSKPGAWRASIRDSGVAIADAARREALAKLAN